MEEAFAPGLSTAQIFDTNQLTMMTTEESPPTMFDVVARRDYDAMVEMYATNGQNAIISYLAMRSRWQSSSSLADQDESKSGT